jgi:hypothetical protein
MGLAFKFELRESNASAVLTMNCTVGPLAIEGGQAGALTILAEHIRERYAHPNPQPPVPTANFACSTALEGERSVQ